MRPTTRTVLAAVLVVAMLVVAGCAGPSANNSSDGAANGTITTIDPADTPAANDTGGESGDVSAPDGGAALVTGDAVR
ncbi:hypothetical protein [Halomarina rubra]|uniref:Uncharacterized protein n=1 Tax=Halomarina rubra TaxID=2071873 RepID=A0ABD6ATL0_9EURY|nr:hypothetical protein [Halomarina rubra]